MNESVQHQRRKGHALFVISMITVIVAIAFKWAWVSIGVEVFSAPDLKFVQILAVSITVAAILALVRVVFNQNNRRNH